MRKTKQSPTTGKQKPRRAALQLCDITQSRLRHLLCSLRQTAKEMFHNHLYMFTGRLKLSMERPTEAAAHDSSTRTFSQVVFTNIPHSYPPSTVVTCHYTLTAGYKPHPRDWVGIFKVRKPLRVKGTVCRYNDKHDLTWLML